MSQRTIAYLGDSAHPGPASYLVGVLSHFGLDYRYVPSHAPPPEELFDSPVGLYVLSDYPAARFSPSAMERLCARVRAGAGLLMLGGWSSYHGRLSSDGDHGRARHRGRQPLRRVLP